QQYEKQLKAYQVQIEHLIEKQKLLIHQLFGQKNEALTPKQDHLGKESALEDLSALEQIKDNAQAELDNDSHTASTNESVNTDSQMLITQSESKQTDTNSDDNKPAKPKRERRIVIPDNLEVRTIIHEPESITCGCGCQMKQIGEDVQDKLGFKPKQFYRERHVYPKYTCRNAACNRERLVQAKTEPQIIDKSIATPELLAHILIS
ncbi:IS66 family transposase, partial [Salmonella enterica subsp. enterica serovar Virchow]|nr:IS66 family transposase [Salmonella enterica subsp. enterica serovar Virchow]